MVTYELFCFLNAIDFSSICRICFHCLETLPFDAGRNIKLCPVDNTEIKETFQDRSALLEIIKIEVACYFKNNGCQWCGMIFNFLDHVKHDCKYSVQWQLCEFSNIGCEKKGSKEEIQKHINNDFGDHLECLGKILATASSTIDQSSSVCESISMTVSECSKQLEEDSDGILAVRTSMSGLESRIETAQSNFSTLHENQLQIARQCQEIKDYDIGSSNVMMYRELTQRLSILEGNVEDLIKNTDVPGVAILSNSQTSGKDHGPKLKRLERDRKTRRENLADSDLKIRLFQATTTDGKYMWKIDNYPRRMKEAKEEKIVELYSPPLFSHVFGYKLCCKIYLNGKPNESCHGTHVSFYMILMKSEYDATLRFPFPRVFRVTLVGRNSTWNVEKKIEPSNTEEFQQPKDDMNKIVGHPMFISHKDLLDSRYLWGDSLFFKIDFTEKSPQFSYYS